MWRDDHFTGFCKSNIIQTYQVPSELALNDRFEGF